MKILAIGRNYVEHIQELNNEKPDEPVVFSKPDSALLRNNDAFYYPDFTKDIHHEVEVVIRISKVGKNIEEKFAHKYYDQFAIGIDFTARDLQTKLKSKGLPWDIAKGFNGSAPISEFRSVEGYDLNNLNFGLKIDGKSVQQGNTSLMMFDVDFIIAYVSQFFTLKKGDLIFTGTPKGVGPVQIGNRLEAYLEDEKVMDFEIK
ncbi:2-keto-4-pentenoate hydratase/2-oxohepta-3-ene-1,7-dioic acid hydratase (catechol pathway) [Reichenbachiella agariperforans]|uniref:2-keto-4-pentenoate hydratase/2-oxohepta-3-ene-1,7-dioic acid hydratase (Catechol pathway) n=1 Tax=Reichenbachiella agariperforans TaxID=156994 RepID=A0A1M6WKF6_REIAG|nr:fumarylacetoacetate hydrolase family protein [Reichenbachiella agariperforans]SHK94283.1 2-keto-4-pentenoate hydratase/2-oxohepta-3-ene-1,7-dioic acid hydratase (catechol pathway) [Reichenbachiella agariperforans]